MLTTVRRKKKLLLTSHRHLKLPKRALTNVDLYLYAKKMKIDNFRGVFMKDSLPNKIRKKLECGIINLDDHTGAGTHWTAYKKKGSKIIFFDSFGNLTPPLEVQKYFNSNGICNIHYNYTPYQSYNSVICGHLCLMFLCNSV